MNNLVQEEKRSMPTSISSQFDEAPKLESSYGNDLKVYNVESAIRRDHDTYIAGQPREHSDKGPSNSGQYESTYLRGTVHFIEEEAPEDLYARQRGRNFILDSLILVEILTSVTCLMGRKSISKSKRRVKGPRPEKLLMSFVEANLF